MKGTRLWQAPGSPLIQGRSAHVRPFWQPWLGACVISSALYSTAYGLYIRSADIFVIPIGFIVVGSGVGALVGVWVARRMGTRNAWLAGVAGGLLGSLLVLLAVGQ